MSIMLLTRMLLLKALIPTRAFRIFILSDTIAHQKFGDRIKVILGPKGTMLFEETSSYHKASHCKTERLMLSIHYVLQRRPPPERATVPSHDVTSITERLA
jgi:hypothetical protein